MIRLIITLTAFVQMQTAFAAPDKPDLNPSKSDKPANCREIKQGNGTIYECRDANGIPNYSNFPPNSNIPGSGQLGTPGGFNVMPPPSVNQNADYNPPQQKDDGTRKACEKALKDAAPKADAKRIENMCDWNGELRRVVTDRGQVKKAEWLSCIKTVDELKYTGTERLEDCATNYKYDLIMKPAYKTCFNMIEKDFDINSAYRDCQDSTFLGDIKDEKFHECKKQLTDAGISKTATLTRCKSWSDRGRIATPAFGKCFSLMKSHDIKGDGALNICLKDDVTSNMSKRDYDQCEKAFTAATGNVLNAFAYCSRTDVLDDFMSNPKCFLTSAKSALSYYAFRVLDTSNNYGDRGYFYWLGKDCRPGNATHIAQASNPYLRLIRDMHIHTVDYMSYPDKDRPLAQIGGLSGLAYDDKKDVLYAISDETYMSTQLPPRIYTFNLNSKLEFSYKGVLPLKFGKEKAPDIDPEGLALLKNGGFIVSSEIGHNAANTVATDKKPLALTNLTTFDANGEFTSALTLPESYKQKEAQGKDKFTRTVGGLEFNKSLESLTVTPDESSLFTGNESSLLQDRSLAAKCKVWRDGRWIIREGKMKKDNKDEDGDDDQQGGQPQPSPGNPNIIQGGIVKVGLFGSDDKGKGRGVRAQMAPPPYNNNYNMNDSICGRIVRIARYEKSGNTYKPSQEFKYALEAEVDNGLVEMLAIKNDTILTLERSYDNMKAKVVSRIFKITLAQESIIPSNAQDFEINNIPSLKKELVLDLDGVVASQAPGFRVLDNFEGMTFGPTLQNGNRTLILVSDNNFSAKQRTAFLIFEVSPELLK